MGRPKKERTAAFGDGYIQLKRSIFVELSHLSPALFSFYLKLLALAHWGDYGGDLGWESNPLSVRDIAHALGMEWQTAYGHLHALEQEERVDTRGVLRTLVARDPTWGKHGHLWLPHYKEFVLTGKKKRPAA